MRFKKAKHFLFLLSAAATVSLVSLSDLRAQGDTYLQQIAANTLGILNNVNLLPSTLTSLGAYILNWTNPDKSDTTSTIQGGFTELGNLLNQNMTTQATLQTMLNSDLLNNNGNNVYNANLGTQNAGGIASAANLWYANDLVYSTLLGSPFFAKDPRKEKYPSVNAPYNYIKNASGLNLYHPIPGSNWAGSAQSKQRYQNYFNTMMAVESYGGYILSQQYADGNQFNTIQTTLIQQATDPAKWFAQVASENIGIVLRQILLYESQAFVLMTQMIQLQKQSVAAQAMTNALLIAINQTNENVMIANAQGTQPTL